MQCCIQMPSKLELPTKHGQGTWFWKNITQCAWTALIPTVSSACSPYLPVVFAHGAPWGGVAGCHTFSPYRPAPRVAWWQKGSLGDGKDISFGTALLLVSALGRGQPVEGFSSTPLLPKSSRSLKSLLELKLKVPTLLPPAITHVGRERPGWGRT